MKSYFTHLTSYINSVPTFFDTAIKNFSSIFGKDISLLGFLLCFFSASQMVKIRFICTIIVSLLARFLIKLHWKDRLIVSSKIYMVCLFCSTLINLYTNNYGRSFVSSPSILLHGILPFISGMVFVQFSGIPLVTLFILNLSIMIAEFIPLRIKDQLHPDLIVLLVLVIDKLICPSIWFALYAVRIKHDLIMMRIAGYYCSKIIKYDE